MSVVAPAPTAASAPRSNRNTPFILGGGVLVIVGMLGMAHKSSVRSERAIGAITAAQKLMLAHAELRGRVGPIVASGSFSMECTDVAAQGWFRTAVMGRDGSTAGRAYVQASRPRGHWASALGWGAERPWTLQELRLEVDLSGLEARAAARRAVAIKAGYMAAEAGPAAGGSSDSSGSSGSSEAPSAIRQALLDLGGQPMEDGLIGLDMLKPEKLQ